MSLSPARELTACAFRLNRPPVRRQCCHASGYDQMLLQLAEDRRSGVQSTVKKGANQGGALAKYTARADGVNYRPVGAQQDDVLMF